MHTLHKRAGSSSFSFFILSNRALHNRGMIPGQSGGPIMVNDLPEPARYNVQVEKEKLGSVVGKCTCLAVSENTGIVPLEGAIEEITSQ